MLLDWTQTRDCGVADTGGKAFNLARLAAYGFAVPDGRVLPACHYRAWLNAGKPALATWPALQTLAASLPDDWLTRPLAVRSSALAEDGEQASFAGIHRSVLGVVGEPALLAAIEQVYHSVESPQARAYRGRFDIPDDAVAMAVLIMPLLDADCAGVAFSCNPATGRRDQMLIQATFGLGETLVSGQCDPDEALLDMPQWQAMRVAGYRIGDKQHSSRMNASGGLKQSHAANLERVLNDAALVQLASLCRDVAEALDDTRPCFDIEWLQQDGQFWIVQARPVTRLGEVIPAALASQGGFWSNGNSRDVAPYVMSPMDWSLCRGLIDSMLTRYLDLSGSPRLAGAERARLLHGRLYLHLSLMQWECHDSLGVDTAIFNQLAGGVQPEIRVSAPGWRQKWRHIGRVTRLLLRTASLRRNADTLYRQALARAGEWRQLDLASLSAAGLADLLQQWQATLLHGEEGLQALQAGAGGNLSFLLQLLARYAPGQEYGLVNGLLADNPLSFTATQNMRLLALARLAGSDSRIVQWLTDPARDTQDWAQRWPQHTPFGAAFAAYLADYGHRAVYESDTRQPRWREAPGYLFDAIVGLLAVDEALLASRRQAQSAAAFATASRLLPWYWRPMLRSLVQKCARDLGQRELARSGIFSYLEPCRLALLHIGQRWQAEGMLCTADDVFYLTLREVMQVLRGERRPGLAAMVADRRRQRAAWEGSPLPDVVHYGASRIESPIPAVVSGDVLQGLPVASGTARGRVRRVLTPDDGIRLQRGEILLAPSTDPAWTPLFLRAGGLIMESGGYLSHGAIVAREFGVPAVVNLPGVLALLQDGDEVEVCGSSGQVRRLAMAVPSGERERADG